MLNPLRLRRLELGLTQIDLAIKTHVPHSYISLQERGYPTLKKAHKEKIARALGTTIDELFPEIK